ncbi:hypothetical protein K402DRAFT_192139 [Aulographum hederae CBS 113979]|uniref:Uncharacterized protein n=1 Tax=Aulographum hederae CBS 113979 TaxID=1176131 RepID=A0A6G1GP16_9PEZI|nr:hypothetical protein K402DRAFT_192139 [Aulographum hederae CBS 113979]
MSLQTFARTRANVRDYCLDTNERRICTRSPKSGSQVLILNRTTTRSLDAKHAHDSTLTRRRRRAAWGLVRGTTRRAG